MRTADKEKLVRELETLLVKVRESGNLDLELKVIAHLISLHNFMDM